MPIYRQVDLLLVSRSGRSSVEKRRWSIPSATTPQEEVLRNFARRAFSDEDPDFAALRLTGDDGWYFVNPRRYAGNTPDDGFDDDTADDHETDDGEEVIPIASLPPSVRTAMEACSAEAAIETRTGGWHPFCDGRDRRLDVKELGLDADDDADDADLEEELV